MTDILRDATDRTGNGADGWMADVQRALALLVIGLLTLVTFILVLRLAWSADINSVVDLSKIMLAALVNMGLIALGFFFGSSQSKEKADQNQAKIIDKLTPTAPVAPPPVAPVATTVPWWNLLTDEERNTIRNASSSEQAAAVFMAAAQAGKASDIDLSNVVALNLLSQARADIIKAS